MKTFRVPPDPTIDTPEDLAVLARPHARAGIAALLEILTDSEARASQRIAAANLAVDQVILEFE